MAATDEVRSNVGKNALVKCQVLLLILTARPTLSWKGHFISTWLGPRRKAGL